MVDQEGSVWLFTAQKFDGPRSRPFTVQANYEGFSEGHGKIKKLIKERFNSLSFFSFFFLRKIFLLILVGLWQVSKWVMNLLLMVEWRALKSLKRLGMIYVANAQTLVYFFL